MRSCLEILLVCLKKSRELALRMKVTPHLYHERTIHRLDNTSLVCSKRQAWRTLLLVVTIFAAVAIFDAADVQAANLQVSPNTGVYTINSTFTVRVAVNSEGKSINAAEGEIKFNPSELSVVSVNRSSSVFNLWVTEPSFSNTAGTISFSGGSPTGYTGSGGTVFTVTFKALRAGTPRVTFSTGSVLANDGRGTNVLSGMNGGTFTVEAVATEPAAEVVEYVAPANTPLAPKITSNTHISGEWTTKKTAVLSWTVPSDVLAVRTLLDTAPTTIPTKVYDSPISTLTLNDLPEGASYFHIQFQNADGWGRVAHFAFLVDTQKPESVTVTLPEDADLSNPIQTVVVQVEDATSPAQKFLIRIDDEEAKEFRDESGEGRLTLPALKPGRHTLIVEAFDAAGNSEIGTFSFTLEAFEKPVFTEFPSEINEEVIPVLRGTTRPGAEVTITVTQLGAEANSYTTVADETGTFTFIPSARFTEGVYDITAQAIDQYGAQSLESDTIRLAVQEPGYVQIGNQVISILSIVVPTISLLILLGLSMLWLVWSVRRFRRRVRTESREALALLKSEFDGIEHALQAEKEKFTQSKKTKKLSDTEEQSFVHMQSIVRDARLRIMKEVQDVENVAGTERIKKSRNT